VSPADRPRHVRLRPPHLPDVRPLDRLRSLKTKLGALVMASVTLAVFVTWIGLRNHLGPTRTLPLSVLLALVFTLVLARGMTAPLREMRDAARAMAGGDYSRRVRASSRDEVGQLAEAFNSMAAELDSVDQTRRDLVANVAHELRTPIAALHAQLENLVDGVVEPSPAALGTAMRQTERLTRLVSYLLDLSRLEAGAADLDWEDVDLAELLEDCADSFLMTGTAGSVRITVEVAVPGLTVPADRSRLEQIVINLLSNAVRHSPAGGTVALRAYPRPGTVVVDVTDEGPGIAAADRERIFARFVRGEASGATGPVSVRGAPAPGPGGRPAAGEETAGEGSTGRPTGGTGIGLSIVRWAAQLHGGNVTVADAAQGATMRLVLPAQRRPAPPP